MDTARDGHTKGSISDEEKQISQGITDRKLICGYQRGKREGKRNKLEISRYKLLYVK